MTPSVDLTTVPLILLALFTLGYAATCAVWPFKHCRRCRGTGHHRSPFLRAYRPCRPCRGTGMRTRWGRRAYNATTRAARAIRRNH
ncbi:hypothetical protein ACFQV2_40405 [Actinokineospora soli]|uniref:Uncharacterized protein n=1 Tax=Actinokineospora soli TaxID=1048753 RepID=A0ABW2TXX3_9PSEU